MSLCNTDWFQNCCLKIKIIIDSKLIKLNRSLKERIIPVVTHPSYSPDLIPCEFFLISKIKTDPKEQ